jgi:hypothetical protein
MKTPLAIGDFLRRAESVYGNRTGILDEPEQPYSLGSLTYGEVAEFARAQAAGLDALGIAPGERVAILSKNSARLLIALFGVSGFGRILVPINFRLNHLEIAYIVEHSGASLLLVDPELADTVADIPCARKLVLGADDAQIYHRQKQPTAVACAEQSTATINYTSGTTAQPKGVQLTHRNLWLNATLFGLHAGVNDRDVYLHNVPYIPVVHGSIFRFDGQVTTFLPKNGPCYRCLYPEPPPAHLAPSCAEAGVLGILPGIIGTLQATEAIKIILQQGETLSGRLLTYDSLRMTFRNLKLRQDKTCPACGENPTITEYIDYEGFCSR